MHSTIYFFEANIGRPIKKMIVIYCSSHGWGHCARVLPIIDELNEYEIEVVATAPKWLFTTSMRNPRKFPIKVREMKTDPGCVQSDPFRMDIPKTVIAFKEIFKNYDAMVNNEVEYLKERGNIRLIMCDISCFGQLVAEKLNVPSVCIATFDWPFIYQNVRNYDKDFSDILDRIEEISKRFDYCLIPGTVCEPLKIGKQRIQLHWNSRKPRLTKAEVFHKLGFAFDVDIVLMTFGGHISSSLPSNVWKKYKEFEFLVLANETMIENIKNQTNVPNNVHYLCDKEWSGYHTDLVKNSVIVMGKLGYGTCAEVLHCKKPFFCVKRIENPECNFLTPVMHLSVPMIEVTPEQFLNGEWDGLYDLSNSKRGKNYVDIETDGEAQIAKWIRYILQDKKPKKQLNAHLVICIISAIFLVFAFLIMLSNKKNDK